MKNRILIVSLISGLLLVAGIARFYGPVLSSVRNNKKEGFVSRVIDGDTIVLSDGTIVRYIGIDTPEIRERQGDEWVYNPMPYGEEAKRFNESLVRGKKVRLELDVQKKDRYDRLLAYVYVGGNMVNLEILRQGYAMLYTYPPNVKYVEEFVRAQKEARASGRGLWSDAGDIIKAEEAAEYRGMVKTVDARIVDTYLTDRVLMLICRGNFRIVIFGGNFSFFPRAAIESPDTYFKHKKIRVYGLIKKYRSSYEIIVHHPSQMQFLAAPPAL